MAEAAYRPPSRPATGIRVVIGAVVPLSDGTISKADIYLPDDDQAHPTLLTRTPYSRGLSGMMIEGFNPLRAARRGYAVVIQDCRGRFSSEGEWDPFVHEAADGVAAVAWCRDQQWSDGRVALWGMSYSGATQMRAASVAPEGLMAISPSMTSAGYGDGWVFESGVLCQQFIHSWVPRLIAESERRAGPRSPRFSTALLTATDDRALEASLQGDPESDELAPYYRRWLDQGAAHPEWAGLDPRSSYHAVRVPGLHIAGWFDIFADGTIENFVGLRERAGTAEAREGQRLIVGPWAHGLFTRWGGDRDFGPLAENEAFDATGRQLEFFDEFVLGRTPDAPVAPVSVFVMGANEWIDLPSWPPDRQDAPFFLGRAPADSPDGTGALTREPLSASEAGRRHVLRYDAADPVPTLGGALMPLDGHRAGAFDQRSVEVRDDVLVFTSAPLEEALVVLGEVIALLRAASDAESFDLCVKLVHVLPDGTAYNVTDGVARVIDHTGAADLVRIAVGQTAVRFDRGDRIRIEVAGSNFPRLATNPCSPAIHEIVLGDSRIELPLADVSLTHLREQRRARAVARA